MMKKLMNNEAIPDFRKLFELVNGSYLLLSPQLEIMEAGGINIQSIFSHNGEIIGKNIFEIYPYKNSPSFISDQLLKSLKQVLQFKTENDIIIQKLNFSHQPEETDLEYNYWKLINTPILDDTNNILSIIHRVEDVTGTVQLQRKLSEQLRINETLKSKVSRIEHELTLCDFPLDLNPQIKILLVDDREDSLYSLEEVLSQDGYQFRKANSGTEALKILLNEQDFSLILMDVQMPIINGIDTAAMIYEREKLKHIPIIFITGAEFNETLLFKGYKTGGVDYIYKPIDPNLLRAKVAVFVELYHKNHLLMAHQHKLKETADLLKYKNAELANANSELEAFTYSVSHDLRAPLRAINGYAQILVEDYNETLDDEGVTNLDKIMKNAQKMGRLIDDLLQLSRVSRKELRKDNVDMNNIINSVLAESNNQIEGRKVDIDITNMKPAMADINLMKQVWINLISNAIKYTRNKENATIHIGSENSKNEIIYYIKDNGVGFDMQYSDKLFGVFQRLHSENEFEGTGVGLAIVHRIIGRHGGRIWANGEVGKGASFFFALPLK